jgi:tetratricopeptide (TPR) repeat protein
MNGRFTFAAGMTLAGCLAGCATPPAPTPSTRPADATSAQTAPLPIEALEERVRARAQAYVRERNWADALVHWELLALLNPDAREYRDALIETRRRIRDAADGLARAAEQARSQGHLDQAVLLYLRLLNVQRDNATAAQALRDIDAERTLRAYSNRAPRMAM